MYSLSLLFPFLLCMHVCVRVRPLSTLSLSLSFVFIVLSCSSHPVLPRRPCTPPGFSAGRHIGTLSSPMCGPVTRAPVSPPRCPLHLALNPPSPLLGAARLLLSLLLSVCLSLSLSLSRSLRPSTLHSEASNTTVRTLHSVHIARCTVTMPAVLKYTAH